MVYNLRAPGSSCICDVTVIVPGGTQQLTCRDVGEMYHAEDALQAIVMEPEMRKALDASNARLIELSKAASISVLSPNSISATASAAEVAAAIGGTAAPATT